MTKCQFKAQVSRNQQRSLPVPRTLALSPELPPKKSEATELEGLFGRKDREEPGLPQAEDSPRTPDTLSVRPRHTNTPAHMAAS